MMDEIMELPPRQATEIMRLAQHLQAIHRSCCCMREAVERLAGRSPMMERQSREMGQMLQDLRTEERTMLNTLEVLMELTGLDRNWTAEEVVRHIETA